MKAYWKNHPALRMVLMLALFVLALVLVVSGWKMTGQLAGLGIMLVGVALLLAVRKGLKAAGNLLLDAHWLGFAEMFGLMLFAIVLYPALFQWVEGRKSKS